jgi:prepilin-type N-terminal cleavage/methylation domain-containing protein
MKLRNQAFTLIELLIVVGIIAILSVVVTLTLQPAQLLMQSRDSQRLSDLATLNTSIADFSADLGGSKNFSLGSSSVTYVSIPDPTATTSAGTDCSGIGFLSGGSFHCAASSTFRNVNGIGWIPVNFTLMSAGSPIGALPVDPVNTTSSNEYYTYQTDGTTFKLRSVPESSKYVAQTGVSPFLFTAGSNLSLGGGSGWVLVPGNSTFGVNNFYVMKYDAVCSDGEGNYINDNNSGDNTYNNMGEACTTANGRNIASLPGGWPISRISQTTAASYCANVGGHLMLNNEWQTIAWNAENVASNWAGGVVGGTGAGAMYSGHNDNVPAVASPADPSDANSCAGTDGPSSCGGTGSNASQRRTLSLSNGSVVWDMAGNIWQWTSDTIIGTNQPNAGPGAFAWHEFTAITTWGTMTQQTAGPANSTWNSSQGIGEINSEGETDGTSYSFVRAGYWDSTSVAGVDVLAMGTGPSANITFGFRCTQ